MPFIEANGTQLFYETYGDDHLDQTPVVLVHGSTITGQADWRELAPLLARTRRVIVPDCRGHGQSANPTSSYSFKELAADLAALIRALGYERAHLIGHSNGGNVVLVALMEHPEVVQTCIPQAANAYVSQDLVDYITAKWQPDRIAREMPEWVREMVALHGPIHGEQYWRTLVEMTAHEIITEPNYTPEQLAAVTRPVFVIQGEHDRTNAPGAHGQFIAQHIPHAEAWLPAGIGHNVHKEIPLEWLKRVEDFWARRGDEANDALYRLGRAHYAETRSTVYDVHHTGAALTGRVLTAEQAAAVQNIAPAARTEVKVLLTETTPWALVNRAVTDLLCEPRSLSERVSQLLLGEAVRVLEDVGEWLFVQSVRDGYLGYARASALHRCDEATARAYLAEKAWLVSADLAPTYAHPTDHDVPPIGKLPFGVTLPGAGETAGWVAVRWPDGGLHWTAVQHIIPLTQRPRPTPAGLAATLQLIRRFVGVPYLWGGRTPFGYDCSGLAGAFWEFMGVTLPRDADQQFMTGVTVAEAFEPGDLLFFGEADDTSERASNISHVAIALGGDDFIHAAGSAGGITYNSLHPASPLYRAWLREHLAGARRYA